MSGQVPVAGSGRWKRYARVCLSMAVVLALPATVGAAQASAEPRATDRGGSHGDGDRRDKPRTIVTTDIETDDYNSVIRYLLYTNEVDTEAIVYTSSRFHFAGDGKGTPFFLPGREYTEPVTSWRWTGTEHIQNLIAEYAKGYRNLLKHDRGYPTPQHLLSLVKVGNINFEGDMAADTEGSDAIKKVLLDNKGGPVYLQVWGGSNTIARALLSIEEQYRDTPQWTKIYEKVSAKAVITMQGKQDTTYDQYISVKWPKILTTNVGSGTWGFYGKNSTKPVDPEALKYFDGRWIAANILENGPLGDKYRVWGDKKALAGDPLDIFGDLTNTSGWLPPRERFDFLSEGDNPAFIYLFDTGLRSLEDWTYGGWGHRVVQSTTTPNYWVSGPAEKNKAGVEVRGYGSGRWAEAEQLDFAARLGWMSADSYADANHHPVVSVKSGVDVKARPGSRITVSDAVRDPDGDRVGVRWWQYREADTYAGEVAIADSTALRTAVTIPADAKPGETVHLILEATDTGKPALTRYQRVIVHIV
ncbi:DUF1593 domain-containing protein [Phytohabitans sp. ZYX-F-186]|uniref:DUF1593 domain-containing protein n=1 Tax=Phytohabitans maris TaxID=3071409 RepID=A0ABU0ZPZ7_9ACTN|nr:DUF1593 domain-containing protein [Phytohabitans sp. ZYX-F-186]MDQ7908300.1 DUF1593 domain-containing protein [Phytohabitans sp. ZYX-F-186]